MANWLDTVLELLEGLPVIGRLVKRLLGRTDPRVAAAEALAKNNDTMSDAMKSCDDPEEMVDALQGHSPKFLIDGEVVEKRIQRRGPFDQMK